MKLFATISMFLIGSIFLTFSFAAQAASPKNLPAPKPGSLCVLIFERDSFPITKAVRDVYDNYPETYVRTYATPKDMLDCVKAGAREVVVIAHLVQLGKDGDFRLGYFQNTKNKDSFHLILNYPFQQMLEYIKSQKDQNQLRLTKFRMMSCGPDVVFNAYPVLKEIRTEIEFEQTPQSPVITAIKGENAVSFNREWLAKDIDCYKLGKRWRTDKNNWCEADHWPGCNRAAANYCLPSKN